MEWGAHLPQVSFSGEQRTAAELRRYAAASRDLGYTHLCANDHLLFSRPWLDGLAALSAVVEHSGTMTLATTVALPVVRGPAQLAKALTAIDWLSDGRLVVGVGPGSSARDYELAGIPFEERWARLDDAVGALRAFFAGDRDYRGRFYTTRDFELAPRPLQQPSPPIWIGSWGSAAGLRRVARLADGWLASGYNTTPELFREAWDALLARLEPRADGAGFPNAIATMWTYVTEDRAEAERLLRHVLQPMLNRPLEELQAKLPVGPAEECAAKLSAYASAGAQRIFIWPIADDVEQLRRVRETVAPLVAAER